MRKRKRWTAVGLIAVLIGSLFAGCGNSSEGQTTGDSTTSSLGSSNIDSDSNGSSKQFDGTELNILMEDVPDTTYVQNRVADFEDQTGIKVNIESVNYSTMHEKLLTQLTANESDYDVLVVDCYWTGEFIEAGWLEDLEPYIKRDNFDTSQYVKSMWDMFNPDNSNYMIPFYNYMFCLLYRNDVFEDEDLKAAYKNEFNEDLDIKNCDSLEKYVQICKFIKEYKKDDGIAGTVCQAQRGDPISMEYLNYLYSNGGEIFDDDGNVVVNSPEAIEALDLYKDNIENGSTEGAASFGLEETTNVFEQGGAATMISYNWEMPTVNNAEGSVVKGKTEIANVPGGHALNAGWAWAIPSNAVNKDASWEFIKYIESFDSCKARALEGGSPTRTDIFQDKDCLTKYPYYSDVLKIMETSKPIPVSEDTPALIDTMGQELSSAVAGEKTSEQALDDLAKEIEDMSKE